MDGSDRTDQTGLIKQDRSNRQIRQDRSDRTDQTGQIRQGKSEIGNETQKKGLPH